MLVPALAVVFSIVFLSALLVLFRYERKTGVRIGYIQRRHFDFWILKAQHFVHVRVQRAGKYILRQIVHYFVHTFLSGILGFVIGLEKSITALLRSNRSLARKTHRERLARNTLEEVALHKMEVALSEEEKQRHKDKALSGK